MLNSALRRCWRIAGNKNRPRYHRIQQSIPRRYASYQNFPQSGGNGSRYSRFDSDGKASGGGTGGGQTPYSRIRPVGRLQYIWRNYRNIIIVVGAGGTVVYATNLEQTPITGRWRFNIVSPEFEKTTASASYQATLAQYRNQLLPPDHPYTKLCTRVVERLIPTVKEFDQNQEWSVHVVDDPQTPNAFVLPGGNVFVFTGIFPIAQDENGLAAVLGHEMAHNVAHHVGERMSSQFITIAAALILSLVFDISGQLGSQISDLALSLPHSRKQETEADHIGLLMMAEACYDPRRSPQIWERMLEFERRQGGSVPQFLSTHPASASRGQAMQQWMPAAMDKYESGNCSITARGLEEFKKIADIGRSSRNRARSPYRTIQQHSQADDDDWPF